MGSSWGHTMQGSEDAGGSRCESSPSSPGSARKWLGILGGGGGIMRASLLAILVGGTELQRVIFLLLLLVHR